MGGGQTSTTNSTQVQNRDPWAPAQQGLVTALNDAQTLYQSGVGNGIYSGPRVADLSNDQSAGIISTRDQAASDNAGGIGTSYLQGITGSNGITPTTQTGLNMLAAVPNVDNTKLTNLADYIGSASNPINSTAVSFMNGARDLTTQPQLQALFKQSQLPSFTEQNLADVAAGKYVDPTTNPLFQNLVNTSNVNAGNAVKEAYAASGRYGSGNFAGATAKAINDTDTALYANQYNTERTNQANANTAMDAARIARLGLGEGVTNDISNVQNVNNTNRLQGAGLAQGQQSAQAGVLGQVQAGDEFNSNLGVTKANGYINAGQQGLQGAIQAAGLLPSVDALRYAPASSLLQVGGLQQNQAQNVINADIQRFGETQQTPWQALSEYASFPTAIGSMGGTTVTQGTQQTHTSGPSPLQSILGGGLSLLGLGTGGGSTLGGGLLSSLFPTSDERAKENIKPVGELADGQTVYSYNYKGSPTTQIGLLAQEVAKETPEAVGPSGIGDYLGVNYAKATEKAAEMAEPRKDAETAKDARQEASAGQVPLPPEVAKGIGQLAAAQMAGGPLQAAMLALAGGAPKKGTMVVVQTTKAPVKGKGKKAA